MENVDIKLLDFCTGATVSFVDIKNYFEIEQICNKDNFLISAIDKDYTFDIVGVCTDIKLEIYLICENDEFIYFITIDEEYFTTTDDEQLTVKK